ncbi:amidohydrolase [Prauserella flavalba]|uniref:Amidohydrolase 3 domain-containing protein n=1 Tax=Prauserella flavalba TaxID=1477506 RepID=A0A318LIQ5_9PSEU|nr:amidohydrolase [Prauserella flavalba]PXY21529.1 hypothetical protein BA062_31975 [Prauserella flavalba]
MTATLVLHNGTVHTLNRSGSIHSAVAINGETIVRVGDLDAVRDLIGRETEVIDLDGRTVLPGFVDAHTHLEVTAHIRRLWIDATLSSPAEVIEAIEQAVRSRPPGEWIVVSSGFREPLPAKAVLDKIAPQHPVIVRRTMHVQMANSLAFGRSGLSPSNPRPKPGCRLEIGPDGEFTGLVEEAFDLFAVPEPSPQQLQAALADTAREMFTSHGVTTIYDMPASVEGVRCLQRLASARALPVRVRLHPILPPVHQGIAPLSHYTDIGLLSGFGDDWLRFGGVKLFVDGHERAAATNDAMHGGRDQSRYALLPRTYEQLVREVTVAMAGGVQIWLHAWGDYAQQLAIEAVEEASRATGITDHRTRIEHMLNAGYTSIDLDRVRAAGIVPVPQASFLKGDQPTDGLPKYVFRDAIDHGLRPAGSSDCTGSQPTLVNPWVGIEAMVARTNKSGITVDAGQAIGLTDALRVYTGNSAYAGFEEHVKGSIEPGKLADLAVVETDPYTVPADELASIKTAMTIIGGNSR